MDRTKRAREVGLALCREARPRILDIYLPDSCIISCAVACEVLGQLGLEATPLPVQVSVYNGAYREEQERGSSNPLANPEAWSVGTGPAATAAESGKWEGGHMVVVSHGVLIDLSLDQFDDPEHGVDIGPNVFDLPSDWESMPALHYDVGPTGVSYFRQKEPVEFEHLPDWHDRERREQIVRDVIGAVSRGGEDRESRR